MGGAVIIPLRVLRCDLGFGRDLAVGGTLSPTD